MNSLEDRPGFTVVKDAINIPDSPILAPQKDLYGLTRDDDPDVASIPGLGLNAFKDRGAIERLDLTQPEASLAVPLDQSKVAPVDLNNTLHAVDLQGDAARQQEKFVLQLSDIGTGIDQVSVTQNENTSVTVAGVYARVDGDFVNLNTLTLDTVDYSGPWRMHQYRSITSTLELLLRVLQVQHSRLAALSQQLIIQSSRLVLVIPLQFQPIE